MKLGQQVKKLRQSLKLTQKEFGERIPRGVDQTYIGKVERGYQYPSLKLVERTARAYDVPVLYFFLEDGGAEAEDFNRYLDVSLNVKKSIRYWMVQKLFTFEEELAQEIEKAIEGALREAQGSERVEQLEEGGKGKISTSEEILLAPLPFCDYPMIAGRM